MNKIDIPLRNNLNLVVDMSNLPSGRVSPAIKQTGELKFKLSGAQNFEIGNLNMINKNRSEFRVFNNEQGNPIPWNPQPVVGKYKVEVQHFARKGDVASAGGNNIINFEIIDSSIPAVVSGNLSEGTLMIAPNPTIGKSISIQTEKNEPLQDVQVYDSNGILVFSKTGKLDDSKVNLSQLKAGLYLIKANNSQGTFYNGKLIINNN